MVIADNRQREMPVPEDRMKPRGEALEYPEAVLMVDPIDKQFKGEVDGKYQYSMESQDIRVHGWICRDPPSGVWQITPSFEFRSGGANKQFLTSHVGPTSLAVCFLIFLLFWALDKMICLIDELKITCTQHILYFIRVILSLSYGFGAG